MTAIDEQVVSSFVKILSHHNDVEACEYSAGVFAELVRTNSKEESVHECKVSKEDWRKAAEGAVDGMTADESTVEKLCSELEPMRERLEALQLESLAAVAQEEIMRVRVGDWCLAVLSEDGDWHEAKVEEIIPGDGGGGAAAAQPANSSNNNTNNNMYRVRFTEYGKPQVVARDQLRLETEIAFEGDEQGRCLICEREMPLTRHHLIPKTTHDSYIKKGYTTAQLSVTVDLCRACHSRVHRAEDEETLAREYFTLDRILAHPEIQKWIVYARKIKKQTLWDHKMLMNRNGGK